MAKYLFEVSYSVDGSEGLLKGGGSGGRDVAEHLIQSFGGKLDAFYYAFGDTDAVLVADVPDARSAAAVSLIANSSGGVTLKTTPLVTVEYAEPYCGKGAPAEANEACYLVGPLGRPPLLGF